MTASVLMAWVGGLLVGGAFGALVMALCVAAGRAKADERHGPEDWLELDSPARR